MARMRWSDQEVADLSLPWSEFREKYPERTYDSWEVKRRRIRGGSAGTYQDRGASVERARTTRLVSGLLTVIEQWVKAGQNVVR